MTNRIVIGEKHSRLTAIAMCPPSGAGKHRTATWRCTCGNVKDLSVSRVRGGYIQSCGCLAKESKPNLKHGMRYSSEYSSRIAMISRCHNESHKDYPRYGACNIRVCDEWRHSFITFYEHIGSRPQGTSIDRINPNCGYDPGNVRWATPHEQSRNRRDLTIIVTPFGKMAIVDYAARIGISNGAAHMRLRRGKLGGCSRV